MHRLKNRLDKTETQKLLKFNRIIVTNFQISDILGLLTGAIQNLSLIKSSNLQLTEFSKSVFTR